MSQSGQRAQLDQSSRPAQLDIRKEAKELNRMYLESDEYKGFNALILGESGSGKTYLLRTARKPVHIDCFDPGGVKNLTKWIASGDIVVDAKYSLEDPKNPTAYKQWVADFRRRKKSGYFNQFATYCIDSSTTFAEAIMNDILRKAGLAGAAPRFTHDYVPQKVALRNHLREAMALPCDFILTGHLDIVEDRDEISGKSKIIFRFMTTGKGTVTLPLLFDELYVCVRKESSKGLVYQLLTSKTSVHLARTRIGAGVFETFEEPDLKKLLAKAGMDASDKPKL